MTGIQKFSLIVVTVIVILVLIPLLYLKGTYNSLISMEVDVKAAWAQVENQLQRRYDLIPNLVETVKGYASHEEEVFLKVTEARSRVGGAGSVSDKIAANNSLSAALSRLLVVVERYPELKANTNFLRLQDELAGTENRFAVERRRYNETVAAYNKIVLQIPTNIIAGIFGFKEASLFEVPEERQEAPKVSF